MTHFFGSYKKRSWCITLFILIVHVRYESKCEVLAQYIDGVQYNIVMTKTLIIYTH